MSAARMKTSLLIAAHYSFANRLHHYAYVKIVKYVLVNSPKFARSLAKRSLMVSATRSRAGLFVLSTCHAELARLLFFSGSMNIRIFAKEGLFLAAKVGYVVGETGTTRRLRTAGRLDVAAPVFRHQMLAEMRSMLRAFLPSLSFCCRSFAGATPFAPKKLRNV